jgi:hypothetical protein
MLWLSNALFLTTPNEMVISYTKLHLAIALRSPSMQPTLSRRAPYHRGCEPAFALRCTSPTCLLIFGST